MSPVQSPNVMTVAGHKTGHGFGLKAASCCKTLGTGKGLCLGLGLGFGVWGPIGLVGVGIVSGYYYWKKVHEMLD